VTCIKKTWRCAQPHAWGEVRARSEIKKGPQCGKRTTGGGIGVVEKETAVVNSVLLQEKGKSLWSTERSGVKDPHGEVGGKKGRGSTLGALGEQRYRTTRGEVLKVTKLEPKRKHTGEPLGDRCAGEVHRRPTVTNTGRRAIDCSVGAGEKNLTA